MRQTQVWKDVQTHRVFYSRYLNILWFLKIVQLHSETFYSIVLSLIDSSVSICLQGSNIYIIIVYRFNL